MTADYKDAGYTNQAMFSFTLLIKDPCTDATWTIEPAILSSTALTYGLYYPTMIEILDDSFVISSVAIGYCPEIEFVVYNNIIVDDTSIPDVDVFYFDSVSN